MKLFQHMGVLILVAASFGHNAIAASVITFEEFKEQRLSEVMSAENAQFLAAFEKCVQEALAKTSQPGGELKDPTAMVLANCGDYYDKTEKIAAKLAADKSPTQKIFDSVSAEISNGENIRMLFADPEGKSQALNRYLVSLVNEMHGQFGPFMKRPNRDEWGNERGSDDVLENLYYGFEVNLKRVWTLRKRLPPNEEKKIIGLRNYLNKMKLWL